MDGEKMIGLVGKKLPYSFSKIIHEKLSEVDYKLIELNEKEFANFFTKKEFEFVNVTIPYKEAVFPHLDYIDPLANRIKAVNTVINKDGKLHGYNTDYYGFKYLLERNNIIVKNKKILILGTGGTSKTITAVLTDQKAKSISYAGIEKFSECLRYEDLEQTTDYQLVINATPVGTTPNLDSLLINLDYFPKVECVIDVIYNPLKTHLLIEATKRNIKAVNGLEMLISQAFKAAQLLNPKLTVENLQKLEKEIKAQQYNIVLIGMSTCGKTAVGIHISSLLKKNFIDTDREIVTKEKKSIVDIFAENGEKYFRKIESQIVLENSLKNDLVIATGGGVIENELNIKYLKQNGVIIFIHRDLELLLLATDRPLLKSKEILTELYNRRLPIYQKYADITIYNNNSIKEAVLGIKRFYDEYFSY